MDEDQKKKIAVIGDTEFTVGFRMAGLNQVFGKENYQEKIQELLDRDDLGILIAEQEDIQELPDRIADKVQESVEPVVVPLSEQGTQKQINEKIKQVIGADIT